MGRQNYAYECSVHHYCKTCEAASQLSRNLCFDWTHDVFPILPPETYLSGNTSDWIWEPGTPVQALQTICFGINILKFHLPKCLPTSMLCIFRYNSYNICSYIQIQHSSRKQTNDLPIKYCVREMWQAVCFLRRKCRQRALDFQYLSREFTSCSSLQTHKNNRNKEYFPHLCGLQEAPFRV